MFSINDFIEFGETERLISMIHMLTPISVFVRDNHILLLH